MQSTNLKVRKWKRVLKLSISDTNTSSRTFTPFTGANFINDYLLQPMLHVNHPLMQFADITDPLLSIAALLSRFYGHRIETWAIKAASYFAGSTLKVSHAICYRNRQWLQLSSLLSSSFNKKLSKRNLYNISNKSKIPEKQSVHILV